MDAIGRKFYISFFINNYGLALNLAIQTPHECCYPEIQAYRNYPKKLTLGCGPTTINGNMGTGNIFCRIAAQK